VAKRRCGTAKLPADSIAVGAWLRYNASDPFMIFVSLRGEGAFRGRLSSEVVHAASERGRAILLDTAQGSATYSEAVHRNRG
jgi:hypothetical protein